MHPSFFHHGVKKFGRSMFYRPPSSVDAIAILRQTYVCEKNTARCFSLLWDFYVHNLIVDIKMGRRTFVDGDNFGVKIVVSPKPAEFLAKVPFNSTRRCTVLSNDRYSDFVVGRPTCF